MEQVISRCRGSYVCESVQEQMGQVLAKIWALKAWLNQPVIRQVTSKVRYTNTNVDDLNPQRLTKREGARPKKTCRSEKENERLVQKVHSPGSNEAIIVMASILFFLP